MNKDKNIELRSEKVRNIIGTVPPILIRYGTFTILFALIVFTSISAFIPYRRIANGIATIYDAKDIVSDSTILNAELEILMNNNVCPIGSKITLIADKQYVEGIVLDYNLVKTTKGKNKAELIIPSQEVNPLINSQVEFRLITSESTILMRFFESIGM